MHEPFLEFIKKKAGDTDIFCLQEVFSTPTDIEFSSGAKMNLYQDISKILTSYQGYHSPKSKGYDYSGYIGKDIDFGNAFFIKKDIPVFSYEEIFDVIAVAGHDWKEHAIAGGQLATIIYGKAPVAICHFHGAWIKGTHKKDTPERIEQSHRVKKMLDAFQGEKILCGDFNLLPDGESIKILEKGMRNLIKDYRVASTRSSFYKTSNVGFADYVLVSPGIKVEDFKVLPDEVSDHLALELDFSI
jgi:endonuclease/exonuclease/phosphatase family metal-dependent hydrolase